jgi:hypothetical protein
MAAPVAQQIIDQYFRRGLGKAPARPKARADVEPEGEPEPADDLPPGLPMGADEELPD